MKARMQRASEDLSDGPHDRSHWSVRLGDELNGWTAAESVGSFAEAESWLYRTAKATIFTPAVVRALAEAPLNGH